MSPREFQIEFERRLQMIDSTLVIENKLSSDLIFSILNEAIDKFWKTRYSGINFKQQAFEQTQKRIDDLRTLVKTKKYTEEDIINNNGIATVVLPEDYMILLGDTAGILPPEGVDMKCWKKDSDGNYIINWSDTIEGKIETIDRQLENSLSEHRLKYCMAKPIKLIKDNNIYLYTDSNYRIVSYTIDYLAKPSKLSLKNPLEPYTDLPEQTHMEIVKLAVQLYLTTKTTNNYQIYSNEIASME